MGKGWKAASKTENAQKKGAIFTKFAREIQIAAKLGGADPAMNARLHMAIEAAKKQSVPKDTIERAIKKGAGLLDDGSALEETAYEGFGPHGVGVIVECHTDNKNRTVPEIRSIFKGHGGNMGETGSVAWMFARTGLIEGTKAGSFDPEEEAIEVGADEVSKHEDEYSFYCKIEDLESVRKNLLARGWKVEVAEPSYKPTNLTELNEEQKKEVIEFLNELDDNDDTHRVHASIKF